MTNKTLNKLYHRSNTSHLYHTNGHAIPQLIYPHVSYECVNKYNEATEERSLYQNGKTTYR